MRKQFCTHEISLKLKEIGFNEQSFSIIEKKTGQLSLMTDILSDIPYTKNYNNLNKNFLLLPLWQEIIDWFREKYKLSIEFNVCNCGLYDAEILSYDNSIFGYSVIIELFQNEPINFHNAREQAILTCIKLIEDEL